MLSDLWPTYRLRITTPRLQLRLPNDVELAEFAALAGQGVHSPSERPFLTPWTEGTAKDRAQFVLREHWGQLSGWAVDDWGLGLGVFATNGEPLGMVTLRSRDFPVVREVTTSSWLGLRHHRHGFGTEARLGLLTLAFDRLAAEAAVTEVFQDNRASHKASPASWAMRPTASLAMPAGSRYWSPTGSASAVPVGSTSGSPASSSTASRHAGTCSRADPGCPLIPRGACETPRRAVSRSLDGTFSGPLRWRRAGSHILA